MRKLLFLFLFLLASVAPAQAAYYTTIWPSGGTIYGQSVTEQNYDMMGVHQQYVSIQLSGAGGWANASSPYSYGSVSIIASVPFADGYVTAYGQHEIYCTYAHMSWTAGSSYRSDRFGTSYLCLRKSLPTCSTNPVTGWVTCTYFPISPCNVRCAAGTAAVIVGASNEFYQFRKRWRETPSGLDCYGSLDFVSTSCAACTQAFDF